jgi:NhaP-type Na+/H+ or K+/H+ antiporter
MTEPDNTTLLFFLFFMALVAVVILLARWLHHQPKLNSVLSEPALVLLVGIFVSFLIKVSYATDGHSYYGNHNNNTSYSNGWEENVDDAMNEMNGDEDSGGHQSRLSNAILSFSGPVFFMALLPPIMFNSGYELKRELFFRHIKPIVSFAAIGTTVSGLVTGFALYGAREAGWLGVVSPSLLELLTFGALIAATDTVSVLGVLQSKRVDPHLFSLVFGESALNDAVAIVLFRTFAELVLLTGTGGGDANLWDEVATFCFKFFLEAVGSPALGILFSFLAALAFKHSGFQGTPMLELSLYILMMYIPFLLAEILHLSGIVTIFFTGMSARRYIEPNVSDDTKRNAATIFKLVAYLAETCIFLDLGLSIFGFSGSFHWKFITFSFLAALLGRAASIYPISILFNLSLQEVFVQPLLPPTTCVTTEELATMEKNSTTPQPDLEDDSLSIASSSSTLSSNSSDSGHIKNGRPHRRKRKTPEKRLDKVIPFKFMHVLWFAGLRGAVAYACAKDFPDLYGNNDEIVAATMVIVLITIIIMGGFCEPLLNCLGIRMDVDDEEYMKEWHLRRSLKGAFHDFGAFVASHNKFFPFFSSATLQSIFCV